MNNKFIIANLQSVWRYAVAYPRGGGSVPAHLPGQIYFNFKGFSEIVKNI